MAGQGWCGGCQEEGWAWPLATLEQTEQQVQQPGQRPTVARLPWPRVRAEVEHVEQLGAKQADTWASAMASKPFTC